VSKKKRRPLGTFSPLPHPPHPIPTPIRTVGDEPQLCGGHFPWLSYSGPGPRGVFPLRYFLTPFSRLAHAAAARDMPARAMREGKARVLLQ